MLVEETTNIFFFANFHCKRIINLQIILEIIPLDLRHLRQRDQYAGRARGSRRVLKSRAR